MKPLLEITREEQPPHPIYLYYSRNPVASTQTLDENYEVAVDFDSSGEVVGIEIVAPTTRRLRSQRALHSTTISASSASLTLAP